MFTQVFLIRHGQTAWSLSGQHTGGTDVPLTDQGEQDSLALGRRLRSVRFNVVFTSPRKRARRTCELAGLSSVAEVLPDLQEWDYGEYEGQSSADIRVLRPEWNLYRDGCPNGESPSQISARADQVIARLCALEGNVAIFSHGHFGRVLAVRWIGLPVTHAQNLLLNTASVSILRYVHSAPQEPVIILWNAADVTPQQRFDNKETIAGKKAMERWENEGGEILSENKLSNSGEQR